MPRLGALANSCVSFALLAGACDSSSDPAPGSGGDGGSLGGSGAPGGAGAGSAGAAGVSAGASGTSAGAGGAAFGGSTSGTSGSTSGGAGASGAAGTSATAGVSGAGGTSGASTAGSAGTSGSGEAGAGGDASAEGGNGGDGGAAEMVVLFDGESLAEWRPVGSDGDAAWDLPGDGTMVVAPGRGNIVSRRTFEDVFVHVEYKTPALPANVTGQDRGNSGVYLNSMYELQVLDSFGLPPAINGCGAIYGVSAPSSTACHEQEVWNTYEIEFRVARFDAQNQKLSPARVLSARLNGVLVQEDVAVPNSTEAGQPEAPGPGPLMLQDHGNRVAFRNIWVIPR